MDQSRLLLDTSAFRALPGTRLAKLGQSAKLYVSPFCFWELLTHLGDAGEFGRIRGNLMKHHYVEVLDNPVSSIHAMLGMPVPSGTEPSIIYAALAALRDSSSIDEFYTKQIQDDSGNARQIADCVQRAREVLDREEVRFTEFVSNVMSAIHTGSHSLVTPADRVRAADSVSLGWGGSPPLSAFDERQLLDRLYFYSAYVVQRAIAYSAPNARAIDGNDYEDARLCLHLEARSGFTVVTEDKRLRSSVVNAIGDIEFLHGLGSPVSLAVLDVSEL
ncbi:MAG: hypothetical protein R3B59_09915 [Dehalococcoidia bacterium]